MSKYIQITINDLCQKITDGSHFSPENDETGKYPMYSVKDMEYNGFASCGFKTIGKDIFVKLSRSDCRPLKNDILIAKDGSYLKYVFKAKKTLDACILSSIAILRPNTNVIEPDYFVHLLRLHSVRNAMANYVSGSALPRIILSDFKKMKLTIYRDLQQQRRIASILSTYDNLIENNTKRIKLLEQMAENLYKEWFVRFRFPGHEKVEMENGLPKGWEIERLGNWGILLESGSRPKGGIDDTLSEGMPSFGAEVIKGLAEFDYNAIKWIPAEFYNRLKRGKNTGNDILLYKDGAYIGKVTLFRDGFPFKEYSINEHVFFISPTDKEYKNYLYFTLHQKEYFLLMQNLNRNAAQPGLSQQDVYKIKMNIPPKNLVIDFNRLIEPLLHNIFNYAKQNQLLTRQRDLLLPRLMSGKLEVKP